MPAAIANNEPQCRNALNPLDASRSDRLTLRHSSLKNIFWLNR